MTQEHFVSHAQNGEDVVLWRALRHVAKGTYVDVGANHPDTMSITRAFYDRGWRGIDVEPQPGFAALLRERRAADVIIEAAITRASTEFVTLHSIDGTGLSTLDQSVSERHEAAGFSARDVDVAARRLDDVLDEHLAPESDIHFMNVDVEGAEADVLSTIDLSKRRPWVLVVESTAPLSAVQTHLAWEGTVLAAGYRPCLFDGLSRFYCAEERFNELGEALSYPACPIDDFVTATHVSLLETRDAALEEAVHWRAVALHRWSETVTQGGIISDGNYQSVVEQLQRELDSMYSSTSWRVTRPLRAVKDAQLRLGRPAK